MLPPRRIAACAALMLLLPAARGMRLPEIDAQAHCTGALQRPKPHKHWLLRVFEPSRRRPMGRRGTHPLRKPVMKVREFLYAEIRYYPV